MAPPAPPLPLGSERWRTLEHAYGPAGDTPGRLARLAGGDDGVLGDLWSSLAHQYSVYTGSIAAFPHLVSAAAALRARGLRRQVICLAATIRAWVEPGTLARVPLDVRAAYEDAAPDALALARAELDAPLDRVDAIYMLQAAAAFAGHVAPGRLLEGFSDEEFACECPSCARDLYVRPAGGGLSVAGEDPVFSKETPLAPVRPDGPSAAMAEAHAWLAREAGREHLRWLAPLLDALFGTARCPSCGAAFALMDRLVEERSG